MDGIWDETETYRTCVSRPVEFNDETYGETRGLMVADAETYGADRLWCLLKPIPVELDSDSETSEPPELPTTEDETVGWLCDAGRRGPARRLAVDDVARGRPAVR